MINKVILLGHLGRDPELRTTTSGATVANFSMATNRRWKDRQSGQQHEETEWHRVVVWGRQAEVAGQYLRRGSQVYVEGRLQTRSWEDRQTGERRWTTEIVCERFQMLGGRGDRGQDSAKHDPHASGSQWGGDHGGADPGPDPDFAADDEDIPF